MSYKNIKRAQAMLRKFLNKKIFAPEEKPAKAKLSKAEATALRITPRQRQILFGTILGDGSLKFDPNGKYANPRFGMRHSIVQIRWFFWKICELKDFITEKSFFVQKPDGYSNQNKLVFHTRALPCFMELHNEVYTNNVVDFEKNWVWEFTPLVLMVWWLDDGGKIGEGARKGKLSTQGWGLNGNMKLQKVLKKLWDIDTRVVQMTSVVTGEDQYYLELSQNNLKKLLRLIMPYIPVKTFVYKAFLTYKDQKLQQSWVAEMKQQMKEEFHQTIDILLEKAQKNPYSFAEFDDQ